MSTPELLALSSRISFGSIQTFRNLTVVPLLDPAAPALGWVTLDAALARGITEITEISESGSVPQLRLLNRGDAAVFLLDGEELVGAKQNRILNLSILVPGGTDLDIPVSCVEQGRWSWRSRGFSGAERVIYSKLRRSNSEAVSASLASSGDRRGDQGMVWDGIASKSLRMSVHSDTGAASALYERHRHDLDEFVAGIDALPGQVGAAFLVGGRFAGLDLFAGADLLAALLPKIAKSYALDALDEASDSEEPGERLEPSAVDATAIVSAIVGQIPQLAATRHLALGLGEDLRLRGDGLVGGALVVGAATAHLAVWAGNYH